MKAKVAYTTQILTSEGAIRHKAIDTLEVSVINPEEDAEAQITQKEELTWGAGCVTVFITGFERDE